MRMERIHDWKICAKCQVLLLPGEKCKIDVCYKGTPNEYLGAFCSECVTGKPVVYSYENLTKRGKFIYIETEEWGTIVIFHTYNSWKVKKGIPQDAPVFETRSYPFDTVRVTDLRPKNNLAAQLKARWVLLDIHTLRLFDMKPPKQ